ncbi:MAG: histidine phosphatase family protein [Ruminococcaceae bacterium]|nr:histidine phosphatase family protein [Oscillospiraceae bacterium]
MKTFKIHFIRHGITRANEEGLYCGTTDVPLSSKGRSQLTDLLLNARYPNVEAVFTSPLSRATETADILFPGLDIIAVSDLREASFGEVEGMSIESLSNNEKYGRWLAGDESSLPSGAEPSDDFRSRCISGFKQVVDEMMRRKIYSSAVVTHGGVIGNILSVMAFPRASFFDWACAPGEGYTAIVDPTIYHRNSVIEVIAAIPDYYDSLEEEI